jgi:hypothetical protein
MAIKFDLYFLKFINETLIREYVSTVLRHEANSQIDLILFISNDIILDTETPTETPASTTPSVTTPQQLNIQTQVKQEQ